MEDHDVGPAAAESDIPHVSDVTEAAVGREEKRENDSGENDRVRQSVAPVSGGGEDGSLAVKRKRGRPKKQTTAVEWRQEFMAAPEYSSGQQKRGRGRPRGSGKWQTLAATLGGTVGDTAGTDFTPCILAIQEGENIVERIWSFSQRIQESLCILSASGTISSAEIQIPASTGRFIKYEGQFSIMCLNGSHTYDEKRSGKICLLSVQLADIEGRFFGGAVAGSLIAGGPTQIIVATFKQKSIRQPPIVTPHLVETPKPNKAPVVVTLPVLTPARPENNKPHDIEVEGVANPHPSDPLLSEVVVTGPVVGHASPSQSVERKLSQPSTALGSELPSSSGLIHELFD